MVNNDSITFADGPVSITATGKLADYVWGSVLVLAIGFLIYHVVKK